MPNFLVLGAGKAGTTSLYEYLDQHPDVYMSPVKETNFFALEGGRSDFAGPRADERISSWSVTDLARYRELFEGATDEKALGEVSPLYLYTRRRPRA